MPAYMTRRERQDKHAALLAELSGPLRRFLPDSWVLAAGDITTRVATFPPLVMVWCMLRQALSPDQSCRSALSWLQSARTNAGLLPLASDTRARAQGIRFELTSVSVYSGFQFFRRNPLCRSMSSRDS